MVKVIGYEGNLLMPTNRHGKVRRLLKNKLAKVVCRNPFTIQLLYKTGNITQPISVGIDTGYRYIGFAVVANSKVIQKGTIELRQNVKRLIKRRSSYRHSRRSRKTWYRKLRFSNRKRTNVWLPPSTQSKYDHILRWIDRLMLYLPNAKLTVEVASFDIQKIENPDISGVDYQHGALYQYENLKQYLLAREKGKCQYCRKRYRKNDSWHIHHIVFKSKGGTDTPKNLALLHNSCHDKLHKLAKQGKPFDLKKPKFYVDATFMNIIKRKLIKDLKVKYDNISFTYGYITKINRKKLSLSKTHYNDAIVITKANVTSFASKPIYIKQVRKKKRSLYEANARKGKKGHPNINQTKHRKNTKAVFVRGIKYALHDKVRLFGKIGYISGFTDKQMYIRDINGTLISMPGKDYNQVSAKWIRHIKRNNNWIMQEVAA